MDVLSDILNVVKLQGSLYFRTEFAPPYGVRVPAFANVARFHMAARGQCWIRVAGQDAVALSAGDLMVIPHGAEHEICDAPETPASALDDVVEAAGFTGAGALVYGGAEGNAGGMSASLVCGHFAFEPQVGRLLLDSLPPYVHIQGFQAANNGWIDQAMKYIALEAHAGQPGADGVINRLSEIMFIQALRHVAETAERGVLAGLRDPQIGRALSAMHKDPANEWSVDGLAREAAMSRTVFSERMRDCVGLAPMQYLTQWRMELASRMLADGGASLAQVAPRVGYRSVGAFIRTFKKHYGMGPGRYQKSALAARAA